jgi:hypothetical protein
MDVSCQFHDTAALHPQGNSRQYPLDRKLGDPVAGLDAMKGVRNLLNTFPESNPNSMVISRYTI